MYSSLAVCKKIMQLAEARKIGEISPMKLIKLAYISHGISLAAWNKKLFDDDVIAWLYGSVVISIYDAVKKYGSSPIHSGEFDYVNEDVTGDNLEAIESAVNIYGEFTAIQLSKITHSKNTPWYKTRNDFLNLSNIIPNDDIKSHYRDILGLPGE